MRSHRGSPQNERSRHGANRDGFNLNSILAGADVKFDTDTCVELQRWTRFLLGAVESFQHRQMRRPEGDHAALTAARKAVFHD